MLRRQHRISQDNATRLINFRQCHAQPLPSQHPNVQNEAKPRLSAYCVVLKVIFRFNLSSCGNRKMDSVLMIRNCALTVNFDNQILKRFKFNILVSFRDLSLIKSQMGEDELSPIANSLLPQCIEFKLRH